MNCVCEMSSLRRLKNLSPLSSIKSDPWAVISIALNSTTVPFLNLRSNIFMAEEFQESEIIFSDHSRRRYHNQERSSFDFSEMIISPQKYSSWAVRNLKSKSKSKKAKMENTLPLKIPESIFRCGAEGDQDEEWNDREEIVPPHVIVDRRIAGKIAFSVRTGNGRTLKGRDLSQVRNSVLRMTGFLEN